MRNKLRQPSLSEQIALGLEDIGDELKRNEQSNIEIETWQDWIRLITPFKTMADWHKQLWEWAWKIEFNKTVKPFVAIAARGGGKSSQCEQLIAALGARGTRKYVLYVRNSQELANSSVSNIGSILENSPIRNYYPDAADKLIGKHGQQKGWTQRMLRAANGFNVVAFGLDSAMRGTKIEDFRPDLICHKRGTLIIDDAIGRWMRVENHPSFKTTFNETPRRSKGIAVSTYNVKHLIEIVTPDHRFKVRDSWNGKIDWVEAKNLIPDRHQIGIQINQEQNGPPKTVTLSTPKLDLILNNDNQHKLHADILSSETEIVYPQIMDDHPDLWIIMGYYSVSGSCKFEDNAIHIFSRSGRQTWRSSAHIDLFTSILRKAKIDHEIKVTTKKLRAIVFTHPVLAALFSTIHAEIRFYTKRPLPYWIERLSNDRLSLFCQGIELYASDDASAKGHLCILNDNVQLLLSIQRIFAKLNRVIRIQPRSPHYRTGDLIYRLILDSERSSNHLENGYLWQLVLSVQPTEDEHEFIPINTPSHIYHTALGISHNCLDDIDGKHDKPATTRKKISTITETILPAGSVHATTLAVQNLIIPTGVFSKLVDGTADFLLDRILSGPHKAVDNLEYKYIDGELKITGGRATWDGQNIAVCEKQMRDWGIKAFLREAQHEVDLNSGGIFEDVSFHQVDPDEVPELQRIICWIDPAMSSGIKSHSQAIQIDGLEATDERDNKGRIYRLYSWEGVSNPSDVIERALLRGCQFGAESIGFETNQGGVLWEESYQTTAEKLLDEDKISYVPQYISKYTREAGKEERASQMLDEYLSGKILHVSGFVRPLEIALGRFPNLPDDLVDAAHMSWYDLRTNQSTKKKKSIRLNTALFKRSSDGSGKITERHSLARRLGIRRRI